MITLLLLLFVVLITAIISGVFGMAGGLILMGVLALFMPVAAAMVTHGAIQFVSNGWRSILHRKFIIWRIIIYYGVGSAIAVGLLTLVTYEPTKAWVFLMLGLVPAISWMPKDLFGLDASKPVHAAMCGVSVTGLNVIAGVSGPLLDIFFIRTDLSRHEIVATKALTQTFSHLIKMVFYGIPLAEAAVAYGLPPWWFFAAGAPLAMIGAWLGSKILGRMSDTSFLKWTRWIVTAIGVAYLGQAAVLFIQ